MPEECLFCRLIKGKECPVVFEDKNFFAFLDHRPVFKGHTLFMTKRHVETFTELPSKRVPAFFKRLQRLSSAVQNAISADGTFVAVNNKVSQSVPHMHFHIVPRKFKDGLKGFFWPRTKYTDAKELENVRKRIAALAKGPV